MNEVIDDSKLGVVIHELGETIRLVRQQLEAYLEDPEDTGPLTSFLSTLQQVHGTVRMVEITGAEMLAGEMVSVSEMLQEGDSENNAELLDGLMRAVIQYADYLDFLATRKRDYPEVLLPIVNDLRKARGDVALSEGDLYITDIDVPVPGSVWNPLDSDDISMRGLARESRHLFQSSLLALYKGLNITDAVARMAEVSHRLLAGAENEATARFWWVASCAIETLSGENKADIPVNVPLKILLGKIDREIKRIIDTDDTDFTGLSQQDLMRNLLVSIGRSRKDNPGLSDIRQAFGITGFLPDQSAVSNAMESITGFNQKLMNTVAAEIKEELENVKDSLDIFIRSSSGNVKELSPLVENLHNLANTLGILGLDSANGKILENKLAVEQILAGERELCDDELMDIASTLLYVENSLNGRPGTPLSGCSEFSDAGYDAENDDAAYQHVMNVVIDEVVSDIATAKEHINTFILSKPADIRQLDNVPAYFSQIKGGLQLAGEEYASSLIDLLNDYISRHLIEEGNTPESAQLDLLADAICSIEYYLESIKEQRGSDVKILSVAECSLQQLGCSVSPLPAGSGDFCEETADKPEPDNYIDSIANLAHTNEVNGAAGLADESEHTGHDDRVTNESVTDMDDAAQSGTEVLMPVEPADIDGDGVVGKEHEDSSSGLAVIGNDIDQEILDIFIEEAEEVIGTISNLLPAWLDNTGDTDSLQTIRRSFHTIKGSGRMVGATYIGEFAWAFENLLNRVIDNSIEAGVALQNLIRDIDQPLSELLTQIKQGTSPSLDITGMMNRAERLNSGEHPVSEDADTDESAVHNQDTTLPEERNSSSGNEIGGLEKIPEEQESAPKIMDDTLYEIFNKETRSHLEALREYSAACHAKPEDCTVTEDLMRILHTLNGCARTAKVESIAYLAGEIHQYYISIPEDSQQVPVEGIEILDEGILLLENILDLLPAQETVLEEYQYLIDRIHATSAGTDIDPDSDTNTNQPGENTEELRVVAESADHSGDSDNYPGASRNGTGSPHEQRAESNEPDMYADLDSDLLEIFMEEGKEILDQSEEILQKWKASPDNMELMTEYQRQLHTLKGGARMVGIEMIGNLSHSLETLVTNLVNDQLVPTGQDFDVLIDAQDRLTRMLEHVHAREPISCADDLVQGLESSDQPDIDTDSADDGKGENVPEDTIGKGGTDPVVDHAEKNTEVLSAVSGPIGESSSEELDDGEISVAEGSKEKVPDLVPPPQDRGDGEQKKQEQVRVRSGLLDDLVNYSGEINIYRSRMEQQVGAFRFNLVEFENTVNRLRDQLRNLEIETDTQILFRYDQIGDEHGGNFDPLELDRYSNLQQLSRSLIESVSDLASIHGLLGNINRESETLLLQQSRVNAELHEGLMHTRMLPFGGLAPRLRRVVRQTCNDLGKKAELLIEGSEAEIDRTVIDRIVAPLEHMLRNAISHGIESQEERLEAGKPDEGILKIELYREGPEVVIRLSDDGAGMDHDSIRRKAIERGLLIEGAALSDNDILQFILETGFSTAKEITQVSGRGVGMDVVNSEVKQLGGSLYIDSRAGQGSVFTIRLPITLSISQALLVKAGDETYCIPLASIEGVVRVPADDIAGYYADSDSMYQYAGNDYKVMHLGVLLGHGMPVSAGSDARVPVLLYRSGDRRIALHVDSLIGNREIVVKSVGMQLSTVQCVSGATILGDGKVSMILDISALARTSSQHEPVKAADSVDDFNRKLSIMVVDDSITVRRVTTRLLERNGVNVVTAKDGIEALAYLQESIPDIMLLDIEMPRMDGFELATHMRNDRRLMHIPIIMITSRVGKKHKQRAMEIGVDRYLGKPYQEHDLMDNIYRLLEEEHV